MADGPWRRPFQASAVLLLVLEAAGVWIAGLLIASKQARARQTV